MTRINTYLSNGLSAGAQFLLKHVKREDTGKCYLSLTREGQPLKTQRTIFSECFYLMALSELSRATGNTQYRVCS